MMYQSLDFFKKLPKDTQVYCAHEYTINNLEFAQTIDPNNKVLKQQLMVAEKKQKNQEPTVPSSIDMELKTNPFLRLQEKAIQNSAQQHLGYQPKTEIETLLAIRQMKDNF